MRRTQPTTKKAKISSTAHVQMLQWLHGKQQQHVCTWEPLLDIFFGIWFRHKIILWFRILSFLETGVLKRETGHHRFKLFLLLGSAYLIFLLALEPYLPSLIPYCL